MTCESATSPACLVTRTNKNGFTWQKSNTPTLCEGGREDEPQDFGLFTMLVTYPSLSLPVCAVPPFHRTLARYSISLPTCYCLLSPFTSRTSSHRYRRLYSLFTNSTRSPSLPPTRVYDICTPHIKPRLRPRRDRWINRDHDEFGVTCMVLHTWKHGYCEWGIREH